MYTLGTPPVSSQEVENSDLVFTFCSPEACRSARGESSGLLVFLEHRQLRLECVPPYNLCVQFWIPNNISEVYKIPMEISFSSFFSFNLYV